VATTTVAQDAQDVFARHLDLAPLRGRRRGLVVCVFHRDVTPSLSIDLDREIFHCFGCGAQGGRNRFAEIVGKRRPPQPAPSSESPLQRARREILAIARRQAGAQPEVQLVYGLSDRIRMSRKAVVSLRRLAEATEDDAERWEVLASAARIETLAHVLEMELDEILLIGRDYR
jgi:CHC2 zinc finger